MAGGVLTSDEFALIQNNPPVKPEVGEVVGAQAPTIEPKPVKQRARKLSGKGKVAGQGRRKRRVRFLHAGAGEAGCAFYHNGEEVSIKLVDGVYELSDDEPLEMFIANGFEEVVDDGMEDEEVAAEEPQEPKSAEAENEGYVLIHPDHADSDPIYGHAMTDDGKSYEIVDSRLTVTTEAEMEYFVNMGWRVMHKITKE